jgi:hypothetical protein
MISRNIKYPSEAGAGQIQRLGRPFAAGWSTLTGMPVGLLPVSRKPSLGVKMKPVLSNGPKAPLVRSVKPSAFR